MNGFLKIGTILCWAVAIGSEYVAQKWPQRKKLLNVFAACMFGLALIGEYGSYRYDSKQEAQLEATIDAQGIPETKWFMAKDADEQTLTIPDDPLAGSVEVLINGLIEPGDVYSVNGRSITVLTKMNHTDQVTIKYRRHR